MKNVYKLTKEDLEDIFSQRESISDAAYTHKIGKHYVRQIREQGINFVPKRPSNLKPIFNHYDEKRLNK